VTIKSDVFAFAVFMWEMATRMNPWHGLGLIGVCAGPLGPGPATHPSDCGWVCALLQTRRTRRVRAHTRLHVALRRSLRRSSRRTRGFPQSSSNRCVDARLAVQSRAFPYSTLLAWKAKFPEAFVTLMEECWRAGTVPPSPMPEASGIGKPEACRRP
jgi:hypothetical protein